MSTSSDRRIMTGRTPTHSQRCRRRRRPCGGLLGLCVVAAGGWTGGGNMRGDARTLIAPPLARRCSMPQQAMSGDASPPKHGQSQSQSQSQSRHQQEGFVVPQPQAPPSSPGATRNSAAVSEVRRALAWAYEAKRGASSSSPPSCSSNRIRGLFQPDARLWLPHTRFYGSNNSNKDDNVPTGSSTGRGAHHRSGDIGGSGGEGMTQKSQAVSPRQRTSPSEETLRGGGVRESGRHDTRLSATTVGSTDVEQGEASASGAAVLSDVGDTVELDLSRGSGVEVIKPDRDERSYRSLVLPNGLEAMLVSDPTTETAAGSMFIRVGHMQDPNELAGMAHFHEHMLFLGTEKYPEEGDFENFLTQHGGSSNAYTATESTNYYFDVEASQLHGATDRFSQFFQTPLFTASSMERELQAVDSEHSNNKNQDTWRFFQILKATANPAHAFAKFGSGNYETLRPRLDEGIDTRKALIEFHEKYYSADAMKLCLLGKEDLDTLEAWVREHFSGVRNTEPPALPDYGPAPAYGATELGRKVTVIPLRETRRLALSWPLAPSRMHKRSKPTLYVSHLLGYEGEGGLHNLLHGRGWITGLTAGGHVSGTDFQLFRLSMSLTEEGERHSDEIVELCHRFIALLREQPPQKRLQDDLAAMGAIRFRFLEKTNPSGAVQNIATTLGEDEAEPAEVLSEPFTIPAWDPSAITDVLERLNPRNCQILVISKKEEKTANEQVEKGLGGWQKEKWYGTTYKVESLPEALLHKLETLPAHGTDEEVKSGTSPEFSLPGPNVFIPTDFSLRADEQPALAGSDAYGLDDDDSGEKLQQALNLPPNVPRTALETVPREDWSRLVPPSLVVSSSAGGSGQEAEGSEDGVITPVKVWHKLDRSYRVPRSIIAAKLWTPEPYGSPTAAVHARLFVRLLKEDLKSWAYDAGMADLRYSLEMTTNGLQLSVVGFSSKVALLLSKMLGHIGELLAEYRELGVLLEQAESGGAPASAAVGEGKRENKGVELTERQRLLKQRFENQRESFLRGYRNVDKEQPHETASYYIRQVMEAEVWHISEYQRALEDDACTPAEMTRYFDHLLTRMHVDALAHGNVGEDEAAALAPAITAALSNPKPLAEDELPTRHALRLPDRGHVVVDLEAATEEEKNSAVQVYLQVGRGKPDLDLSAALEFINVIGYTSAFQQLRTQEQLGYIVYTQLERGPSGLVVPPDDTLAEVEGGAQHHPGGPMAWSIVVQSPDKSPAEIEERIEAWIAGFRDELAAMPADVFDSTVASMRSTVLRRERSMSEEAQVFFSAVAGRTHDFYRRYRKAEAYSRLTKEAVLAAFDASLAPDAPGRRKLSVRVGSQRYKRDSAAADAGEQIADGGIEMDGLADDDDSAVFLRSLEEIRAYKANAPIYE